MRLAIPEDGPPLTVTTIPLPAHAALAAEWRALEASADASFFLSWHWIGNWLGCLGPRTGVRLARVSDAAGLAGLAILMPRAVRRHRILRTNGLFLNSTGDAALDEISIEHNGMLARRGLERSALQALVEHLLREPDWDELFLDGVCRPEATASLQLPGARLRTWSTSPSRLVRFAPLREAGKPFDETLAKQTRYNLRRSQREYEKHGALVLDEAASLAQAREFLGGLRALHQRYWEGRGHRGAFANAFFARFHEKLVDAAFDAGVVQLLRARAGDRVLGYLYNYVYGGRVSNYQSGFDYASGNLHERPGVVMHAMAIQHNLARGHDAYDFLAGDSDLKRRFSNDAETLEWQVVRRDRFKLRLEDALRGLRRRLQRADAPAEERPQALFQP